MFAAHNFVIYHTTLLVVVPFIKLQLHPTTIYVLDMHDSNLVVYLKLISYTWLPISTQSNSIVLSSLRMTPKPSTIYRLIIIWCYCFAVFHRCVIWFVPSRSCYIELLVLFFFYFDCFCDADVSIRKSDA